MKRKRDGGSGLIFRDGFGVKLNKRKETKMETFCCFSLRFSSFLNEWLWFLRHFFLSLWDMSQAPPLLHHRPEHKSGCCSLGHIWSSVTFHSVFLRRRCQLSSKLLPLHFWQHTLQTQHPSSLALLSRSVFNKLPPELVSIRAQRIDPKQEMERTQLLLANSLS